jgi:hypothetical protein
MSTNWSWRGALLSHVSPGLSASEGKAIGAELISYETLRSEVSRIYYQRSATVRRDAYTI